MITNKKIYTLLKMNRGDIKAFAKFTGMSVQGLLYRLKSDGQKSRLDAQYQDFLVKKQEKIKHVHKD